MNIDDITATLVSDTLRAWRSADDPPPGLLALDILRESGPATPVEREIHLRGLIESIVSAELAAGRAAEGLPGGGDSRVALLAAVGDDFGRNNAELERWSALYHRFLAPVPLSMEELAAAAPLDVRNMRRRVNGGIERLTDRLRRLELAQHERAHERDRGLMVGRHLPPPDYHRLFGVDAPRRELAGLLRRPDGPAFVSVEGLGGIGKTALALAVAHNLAQDSDYNGMAWISARQTWLNDRGEIETAADAATTLDDIAARLATQLGFAELAGLSAADKLERLTPFLRNYPHLIVIDNLETISDVALLMPALMPLAGPTRFLLTSRETLSHYPVVTRFPARPLSREDSRALVESELRRHGRGGSLKADHMDALHAVIGGMPLALKLVAAQMRHWPLLVLLDNLRQARRRAPEHLYTFIYRRSWLALGDPARELLLSLLALAPDGEDIEWLRLMSFLPPDAFDDALAQLLDYSLLETGGDPAAPRYRLHRLTTTFLQTQVLESWDAATAEDEAI